MIDLYYWPTPNGRKASIMLEECGLSYNTIAINIGRGEQFSAEFLAVSPNNRIPAIVDHEVSISLFESGAILTYLADKTGRFIPEDLHGRYEVMQWLFWQMGNLGPMAGQLSHFVNYAPEPVPYAHDRYKNEYDRLLGVMDFVLNEKDFLAGEYSIADIASFPWITAYKRYEVDLDKFPNVRRWFDNIKNRPAVRKGIDVGREQRNFGKGITKESLGNMFNQTAKSVKEKFEK